MHKDLKTTKPKNIKTQKHKFIIIFLLCLCFSVFPFLCFYVFSQNNDIEFTLDVNSSTIDLPKIFNPNIDLSGRGFHDNGGWPQVLASQQVLDTWSKDIGFSGIYRLQYNLWQLYESAKYPLVLKDLLSTYENIIKKVSDSGGIVILNIFATPPGMGKALDRRSPPVDILAFKEMIKQYIREFSCVKKYNIWYEIWSAPDLNEFFLGTKQDYFNIYKAVAEGVKELEAENKIHIPLGGPGVSWWFQNCDGNTVFSPEQSMLYEFIRFCSNYKLPLDFLSWHAYSTDPNVELDSTVYGKTQVALIREWLSYFNFDKQTPLFVDEWNYDSGANLLAARFANANICASYIPARIQKMFEAGLDLQVYFSMEDFQDNKEHVVRNVGAFWYDLKPGGEYLGGPKSIYNVFRMLSGLDKHMFVLPKAKDEFVNMLATKNEDRVTIMLYNYIDPDIGNDYISRNIASLNAKERKLFLALVKSGKLQKIVSRSIDIEGLGVDNKLKTILKKAQDLSVQANVYKSSKRNVGLSINNLNGKYILSVYSVDEGCHFNCGFNAVEEKEVEIAGELTQAIEMPAYSVKMIVLKKKPKEPEPVVPEVPVPAAEPVTTAEPKEGVLPPVSETPQAVIPDKTPVVPAVDLKSNLETPTPPVPDKKIEDAVKEKQKAEESPVSEAVAKP